MFGFSPAFVRAGAVLGVGVDAADQGRQVGAVIPELLKKSGDSAPVAVAAARNSFRSPSI